MQKHISQNKLIMGLFIYIHFSTRGIRFGVYVRLVVNNRLFVIQFLTSLPFIQVDLQMIHFYLIESYSNDSLWIHFHIS